MYVHQQASQDPTPIEHPLGNLQEAHAKAPKKSTKIVPIKSYYYIPMRFLGGRQGGNEPAKTCIRIIGPNNDQII
jgi:hypothetical protein